MPGHCRKCIVAADRLDHSRQVSGDDGPVFAESATARSTATNSNELLGDRRRRFSEPIAPPTDGDAVLVKCARMMRSTLIGIL